MSTAVADAPQADTAKTGTLVVKYNVSDEHIAKLRAELTGLTAETPAKYEIVRKGIATCRELRVGIEKTRVALKEDSIKFGRMVDAEAKRITAAIEAIENPLKAAKQAVDDEAARVKREKEEAEQRAREEQARLAREAEEKRLREEREAEERRLKAEQERLAEERRQFEAQRAEQEARDRAERERLAAERAAFEEQQRKAREEEERRQAAIRAEQEAKERAEQERIAAQNRAKHEAEVAARREALKPDLEKVRTWATGICNVPYPVLESDDLHEQVRRASLDIARRLDVLIEQITEGP